MAKPKSNTSEASYKIGKQEEAGLQSSTTWWLAAKYSPSSSAGLSLSVVRPLSIDMLMLDLPAEKLE